MTDQKKRYLEAVLEDYPDLLIQEAELNSQEGQYNDLLIINQQLIFRFPRFAGGLNALQREASMLEQLQGKLSLAIPCPLYLSSSTKIIGKVFIGYPKIKGEPLWHERFQAIKDPQILTHLAFQLANFLYELHSIPVEQLGFDLPINDLPRYWEELYEEIQSNVFTLIRADARKTISRHFESFINDSVQNPFEPTLRHGDFGSGNILYDQETQSISGVIDFGSAGLGDPALDIAAAMTFGERFFNHYYTYYPGITSLIDRAKFYKGTFALQEALYGAKHGDQGALERGIAPYT